MTDTKFTPGPWRALSRDYVSCAYYVMPRKGQGAVAHIPPSKVNDEKANALLIAAAPELYEALEMIVRAIDSDQYVYQLSDLARAALAKARGE